MMREKLRNLLFGTLRRQLIISVALVHAVMMTLFIWDVTQRQKGLILARQTDQAISLAQALATSAAEWLAADDISGLQELAETQQRYPELEYAMFLDSTGRILGHTDRTRIGAYVLDLPDQFGEKILSQSAELVDVMVPARLANRNVGWARVGIGQQVAGKKLGEIIRSGVFYAFGAIILGSLLAGFMAQRLTRRLYKIQSVMDEVRSGNFLARSTLIGTDEAALMATNFNMMLNMLGERDQEVRKSEDKFRLQYSTLRGIIDSANALIFSVDRHYRYTSFNKAHATVMKALYGTQIELGHSLLDYMTVPNDRETAKRNLDRVLAGEHLVEESYSGEELRSRKYFQVSHNPIKTEEEEIIGVAMLAQDLTERKHTEDSIRLMGLELQTIYDNTYAMFAYLDRDFKFIRVNRAYAEADKKHPDFFIGKNHFELYPNAENEAIFRRVVETGRPFIAQAKPFEYPDHPEWGATYWDWTLVPVFSAERTVTGLIFTLLNVTERKQAEEERRRAFEALRESESRLAEAQRIAKIGNWMWDVPNNKLWWSDETFHIFAMEPTNGN